MMKQTASRPGAPRRGTSRDQVAEQATRPRRTTSAAKPTRTRTTDGASIPRSDARRPRRATNQNTVGTRPRNKGSLSVGGLDISTRLLAVILVAALVMVVLVPTLLQWSEQQREYRAINAQVAAAQVQIDQLEQDLENWSDPDYISAQARSRLGYRHEGETQFSVLDAPELESDATADPISETVKQGPAKPWILNLEKELLDLDNPPAVTKAIDD